MSTRGNPAEARPPAPPCVTITGPPGSGKTTVAHIICKALRAHGLPVTVKDGPREGEPRAYYADGLTIGFYREPIKVEVTSPSRPDACNYTRENIRVEPGQVWQSLLPQNKGRTRTILHVEDGKAYYSYRPYRGIHISRMHLQRPNVGWRLVRRA